MERGLGKRAAAGAAAFMRGLAVAAALVMAPVALLVAGCFVTGSQLGHVRTGSMDPAIPQGSLIVSTPVSADQVSEGMVLQFVSPEDPELLVTHRVQAVERDAEGNLSFVTKGDANPERDSHAVPAANVRAKVRWHVDDLGALLAWVQWPRQLLFVVVPVALLLLSGLLRRLAGDVEAAPATVGDVVPLQEDDDVACSACGSPICEGDRYCWCCGCRAAPPLAIVVDVRPLADVTSLRPTASERGA